MISEIKKRLNEIFCSHSWKYWDYVGDLPDRSNHEIRLHNKFRKCVKCNKRQKKNTMPNKGGFQNTTMIWNEDYPIVGKITKSMKREARLKKLLDK